MTEDGMRFEDNAIVPWLRQVSPYFQNHRNKTFVVCFGGETVAGPDFANLIRDLVLLAAVGIRLVVVFGARPQIEERLAAKGVAPRFVGRLRVSDREVMAEISEVVGAMRLGIESEFSLGGRGGPIASAASKIAGGNFVLAMPAGIIDGVDLGFTGLVRSVNRGAIESRLNHGEIVLLAPLGYSPTGDLFNVKAEDLAAAVAGQIEATKLVLISGTDGITSLAGRLYRQLTVREAVELREIKSDLEEEYGLLDTAVSACQLGVERVHIVSRFVDGAILRELFTRDGIGTLISSAPFDHLRQAVVEDVGGILELIQPLEARGILVKRSREKLETEIEHFVVMVRENTVVACGALSPYEGQPIGEVACIAVHPDYRGGQFGDVLLEELERRARDTGISTLFVLTTQAVQWFNERGFDNGTMKSLPVEKRELYNYQRNSAVLVKSLT